MLIIRLILKNSRLLITSRLIMKKYKPKEKKMEIGVPK